MTSSVAVVDLLVAVVRQDVVQDDVLVIGLGVLVVIVVDGRGSIGVRRTFGHRRRAVRRAGDVLVQLRGSRLRGADALGRGELDGVELHDDHGLVGDAIQVRVSVVGFETTGLAGVLVQIQGIALELAGLVAESLRLAQLARNEIGSLGVVRADGHEVFNDNGITRRQNAALGAVLALQLAAGKGPVGILAVHRAFHRVSAGGLLVAVHHVPGADDNVVDHVVGLRTLGNRLEGSLHVLRSPVLFAVLEEHFLAHSVFQLGIGHLLVGGGTPRLYLAVELGAAAGNDHAVGDEFGIVGRREGLQLHRHEIDTVEDVDLRTYRTLNFCGSHRHMSRAVVGLHDQLVERERIAGRIAQIAHNARGVNALNGHERGDLLGCGRYLLVHHIQIAAELRIVHLRQAGAVGHGDIGALTRVEPGVTLVHLHDIVGPDRHLSVEVLSGLLAIGLSLVIPIEEGVLAVALVLARSKVFVVLGQLVRREPIDAPVFLGQKILAILIVVVEHLGVRREGARAVGTGVKRCHIARLALYALAIHIDAIGDVPRGVVGVVHVPFVIHIGELRRIEQRVVAEALAEGQQLRDLRIGAAVLLVSREVEELHLIIGQIRQRDAVAHHGRGILVDGRIVRRPFIAGGARAGKVTGSDINGEHRVGRRAEQACAAALGLDILRVVITRRGGYEVVQMNRNVLFKFVGNLAAMHLTLTAVRADTRLFADVTAAVALVAGGHHLVHFRCNVRGELELRRVIGDTRGERLQGVQLVVAVTVTQGLAAAVHANLPTDVVAQRVEIVGLLLAVHIHVDALVVVIGAIHGIHIKTEAVRHRHLVRQAVIAIARVGGRRLDDPAYLANLVNFTGHELVSVDDDVHLVRDGIPLRQADLTPTRLIGMVVVGRIAEQIEVVFAVEEVAIGIGTSQGKVLAILVGRAVLLVVAAVVLFDIGGSKAHEHEDAQILLDLRLLVAGLRRTRSLNAGFGQAVGVHHVTRAVQVHLGFGAIVLKNGRFTVGEDKRSALVAVRDVVLGSGHFPDAGGNRIQAVLQTAHAHGRILEGRIVDRALLGAPVGHLPVEDEGVHRAAGVDSLRDIKVVGALHMGIAAQIDAEVGGGAQGAQCLSVGAHRNRGLANTEETGGLLDIEIIVEHAVAIVIDIIGARVLGLLAGPVEAAHRLRVELRADKRLGLGQLRLEGA